MHRPHQKLEKKISQNPFLYREAPLWLIFNFSLWFFSERNQYSHFCPIQSEECTKSRAIKIRKDCDNYTI